MKCILCIDNDINDKDSGFVRKKISTLLDFEDYVPLLQLLFGQNIEVKTSNLDEVFLPESSTQEITPSINDGIYLGGLGSQNKMISGKSKLRYEKTLNLRQKL